jgi:hypothetical protein
MANEFVARNGLIALDNSIITGSLTVTSGITGSLQGTASWTNNALTSSYALFAANGGGGGNAFPYTGSAIISGSLTITGSLNAASITGSLEGTSSWANNAISASYALNSVGISNLQSIANALIFG